MAGPSRAAHAKARARAVRAEKAAYASKQQRQAPKAPRPRRARKSGGTAGVMAHFDAFHSNPERPLALVGGGATAIRGRRATTITIAANTANVVVVNAGRGSNVYGHFAYNTPTATWATLGFTTQMFTPAPDTWLPTKCSVTLLDTTKALDAGGHVKVLRTPQSLTLDYLAITQAQQDALLDLVRGHSRSRTYGHELRMHAHTWHTGIVNGVRYQQFSPFQSTWTDSFIAALDDPVSSTIIFLFEPYSVARTFELVVGLVGYARYPALNLMSAMQRPIPQTTQSALTAAATAVESLGSAAARVGEAALGGAEAAVREVAYGMTGRAAVRAAAATARMARLGA